MNKFHKTVWSQPLNQWVVSSELAKGKSKSSSNNKSMLLFVAAAMALSASTSGWAACSVTGSSTTGANCSDSNVSVTNANISKTEATVIDVGNVGTPIQVNISGNNTLHVIDGVSSAGSPTGMGLRIDSSSGTNVHVTGGTTTITLDANHGDTAILINGSTSNTAHGIVTVDANATLNIINNSNWRNTENDGIEIDGSGRVELKHNGQGTIETAGGNAVFLRQAGTTEGITVDLVNAAGKGNVVLETSGSSTSPTLTPGNHGISVAIGNAGNTVGVIDIKTNAKINTHGGNANGIFASTANGTYGIDNIKIDNQGDITTNQLGSSGIVASGHVGGIRIQNSGSISTQQGLSSTSTSRADGIYAINQNGDSYIENQGVIVANGNDSAGVRAEQAAGSTTGNIKVVTDAGSNITASGLGAEGIHANIGSERLGSTSASDGNVEVDAKGNITTKGNGSAEGIYAAITKGALNTLGGAGSYSTGNIDVTFSGDTIRTTGTGTNRGILVRQDGTGGVNVTHTGNLIATSGDDAHAISVSKNNTGNTATSLVQVDSRITTSGAGAHAINQYEVGSGRLEVDNNNDTLTTTGNNANGMNLIIANGGLASGGIDVKTQGSTINTTGANAHGIFASTTARSGDITINLQNTVIDLKGDNSDGIGVFNENIGASNLNIDITTNGGSITTDSATAASSVGYNYGIVAYQKGVVAGDVKITNNGTSISTGLGPGGSKSSSAIYAAMYDANATGNIVVTNSGTLSTKGDASNGIAANQLGSGIVHVVNNNTIQTSGAGSSGIYAVSQLGQISIANTANMQIQGDVGNGIFANSQNGGAILIDNATGSITVGKAGNTGAAIGITARADNGGNATILSVGNIGALGSAASIGVEAKANTGLSAVQFGQGEITGSGSGIAVSSNGQLTGTSSVLLDKNGVISVDGFGVISQSFGGNKLITDETSIIRSGAGVQLDAQNSSAINQFEHFGLIDTRSDLAINENSTAGTQTNINNYGTIYGYIDAAASTGDIHFSNYSSNSWNIRNYFDSNGDGVKDTKAVAVSNFGAGFNEVTNAATGTLRLAAVNDNLYTDTTGEYMPRFTATPSTQQNGIVQGHLLNLDVFRNAGTIDLTANNQPGDVLLVSGGTTPGVNGGGVYISDGGVLKLNTTLNIGGLLSESDILVVDNVKLGSGATQVDITPSAWSTGGKTIGDGIKVVEVQGTSNPFAFTLVQPMTVGAFDYYLSRGTWDQSWYLKNEYTAAVGGYLSNQHAAATMFNMNIHDRRDNVRDTDSTLWVRLNHTDLSTKLLDNSQTADMQTTLIQVGADVFKKDSIVAGVYAGYGNSSSSIDTRSGLSSASGKVDGYHVGAYASWLPEENKGPYVDLWGYYAWYKNKLDSSRHLMGKDKYDSKGWSLSAEAGYSFAVKELSDGKTWIIQPHAQVIYTHINTDDFTSKLGTTGSYSRFHGSKSSGVLTRLGARTYWTLPEGDKGLSPFIELNWLHNGMSNEVKVDYDTVSSKMGKNIVELKLGSEGKVTDKMSVWGHIGGQHGSNDYTRYEIQLGLGWHWK